jgi:hypothetical protein
MSARSPSPCTFTQDRIRMMATSPAGLRGGTASRCRSKSSMKVALPKCSDWGTPFGSVSGSQRAPPRSCRENRPCPAPGCFWTETMTAGLPWKPRRRASPGAKSTCDLCRKTGCLWEHHRVRRGPPGAGQAHIADEVFAPVLVHETAAVLVPNGAACSICSCGRRGPAWAFGTIRYCDLPPMGSPAQRPDGQELGRITKSRSRAPPWEHVSP